MSKFVYMITWSTPLDTFYSNPKKREKGTLVVCNEYKTARAAKKQINLWCKGKNPDFRKIDHKIYKVRKNKLKKYYKNYGIEI